MTCLWVIYTLDLHVLLADSPVQVLWRATYVCALWLCQRRTASAMLASENVLPTGCFFYALLCKFNTFNCCGSSSSDSFFSSNSFPKLHCCSVQHRRMFRWLFLCRFPPFFAVNAVLKCRFSSPRIVFRLSLIVFRRFLHLLFVF